MARGENGGAPVGAPSNRPVGWFLLPCLRATARRILARAVTTSCTAPEQPLIVWSFILSTKVHPS
jgi:hypothetical protein